MKITSYLTSVKNKIRTKILFWLLTVNLSLLVILGSFYFNKMASDLMDNEFQSITMTRDLAAKLIEDDMNHHLIAIKSVAHSPIARAAIEGKASEAEISTYLEQMRSIYDAHEESEFSYLHIIDSSGTIVSCTGEAHKGMNINDRPYIQAAIKGDTGCAGPYHPKDSTAPPYVIAYAPVMKDDMIIGSVMAQIQTEHISRLLQSNIIRRGRTAETYLVGIRQTDELDSEGEQRDTMKKMISSSRFMPFMQDITVDNPAVNACMRGETGTALIIDYRGEPVLSAYTPITGGNWCLFSEKDQVETLKAVLNLRTYFIKGGLTLLIAIILISIYLSRRLTRPIMELREGAGMIASGQFSHRISIKTGDEIQALADDFNQMASRLETYYEDLENKVRDRTYELDQSNEELMQEVEERTQTEEELLVRTHELEISKSLMDKIFRSIKEGILINDPVTREIESVNKALEDMWGYRRDELIGSKTNFMHINADAYEKFGKAMRSSLSTQDSMHTDYEFRRKDGSTFTAEVSVTGLFDEGGKLNKTVGVFRDITERRQTEIELQLAKEKAEGANRIKSEFLARMSHEIRTPMNAIIGISDILMEDDLTADQMEHLNMLKYSADSLLTIIDDILDISKIEAGKIELHQIEFSLKEILDNTIRALSVSAREKGILLSLDISNSTPEAVMGDPVRLSQVLINLLANAIKFTDSGSVKLQASLHDKTGRNIWIHFSVSDTGIGISEEKIDNIFEAFSQGDSSISRRYGGTGLGLTISCSLVSLMKGNLRVKNNPEGGSTFDFTACFAHPHEDSEHPTELSLPLSGMDTSCPAPKKKGINVLLVEDNLINQKIARKILQKSGHSITTADNGQEAIDKLRCDDFDVIIMDIEMPGMNGYETAAAIRNAESATDKRTPVIAMTAHAGDGTRDKCIKAGMDEYISKPINAAHLLEKIYAVLR